KRNGLDTLSEVEGQLVGLVEQNLGGFPPQGPGALHETGREEDRIGDIVLAKDRSGELGIVAVAIIEREAHKAPAVGRIRKESGEVFGGDWREAAFERRLDCFFEELRRYGQDSVRLEGIPILRADMVEREDDPPATRLGGERQGTQ